MQIVSIRQRKREFEFLEKHPNCILIREWVYQRWDNEEKVLQYVFSKDNERIAIDIPLDYKNGVKVRGDEGVASALYGVQLRAKIHFNQLKKKRQQLRELI